MELERQQSCVAAGSMLIASAGVVILVLWYYAHLSEAIHLFQGQLCQALLIFGVTQLVLGIFGACAACLRSRWALCSLGWCSLLLGTASSAFGVFYFVQVYADSTRIDRLCEEDEADPDAHHAALAAQRSYDSLLETLTTCRLYDPFALCLDTCASATDSQKRPWQTNAHKELFKWAEGHFACSGFCEDNVPLFALPQGTVTKENMAKKRHACFAPITAEIRRIGALAAAAFLVTSVLLLAPACCACWLACAPPPKRRVDYVHRPEELAWKRVPQEEGDYDERSDSSDAE